MDLGAAFLGSTGFLQLGLWLAFGVTLLPHVSVAPDFQIKLVAECIYTGNANTVQAA